MNYPFFIRICYLLLTASVACALINCSLPLDDKWIIWSALLLMLITAESFWMQCFMIIASGFLSATFILIGRWFPQISYLLPIYTGLLLAVTFYLIRYYAIHLWVLLPFGFFVILGNQASISDKHVIALSIVVGTLVALLPQCILYWRFTKHLQQGRIQEMIKQLKILNQEIFACYLSSQYQEEKYIYERRIHQIKKYYLRASVSFAKTVASHSALNQLVNHFDHLFDILMNLAQLRTRVEDFTIFNVCHTELTAVCDELDSLLKELYAAYHQKNLTRDVKMFQQQIQQLETLYQRVLQVTAPDPFVFVLFIGSLHDAAREVEELFTFFIQAATVKGDQDVNG